jgi:polysaccharide export outer membrane protein
MIDFRSVLKTLALFLVFACCLVVVGQAQSLNLSSTNSSAFGTNVAVVAPLPAPTDPMVGVKVPPVVTTTNNGTAGLDVSDLLRIGDTLIIRLTGVPQADQGIFEVKIDESGKISMPYIGSLSASNATTVQLKKLIETTYIKEEIFTNPNVTVDLKEQRFVDVTGEVRMPQRVPYTKDLTAMGAVAACGGFTDFANRRRVKLSQGGVTREFNAKDIQADQGRDIKLTPNDKIQVDRSIF